MVGFDELDSSSAPDRQNSTQLQSSHSHSNILEEAAHAAAGAGSGAHRDDSHGGEVMEHLEEAEEGLSSPSHDGMEHSQAPAHGAAGAEADAANEKCLAATPHVTLARPEDGETHQHDCSHESNRSSYTQGGVQQEELEESINTSSSSSSHAAGVGGFMLAHKVLQEARDSEHHGAAEGASFGEGAVADEKAGETGELEASAMAEGKHDGASAALVAEHSASGLLQNTSAVQPGPEDAGVEEHHVEYSNGAAEEQTHVAAMEAGEEKGAEGDKHHHAQADTAAAEEVKVSAEEPGHGHGSWSCVADVVAFEAELQRQSTGGADAAAADVHESAAVMERGEEEHSSAHIVEESAAGAADSRGGSEH